MTVTGTDGPRSSVSTISDEPSFAGAREAPQTADPGDGEESRSGRTPSRAVTGLVSTEPADGGEPIWQVYILRCADGTLYTGIAKNLARRLDEHNSGRGARYTRSRLPVELVYKEAAPDHGSALKREHEIKRLSAAGKRELISIASSSR